MRTYTEIIFLFLIVLSIGSQASTVGQDTLSRQKRQTDILQNTSKLIEDLARNLRTAAQQAIYSILKFTVGIQEQVGLFQTKVREDLYKLRDRVSQTIKDITDRFQSSGTAVMKCLEAHRSEADVLFNKTVAKTMGCAEDRVADITGLIEELTNMSKLAMEGADLAIVEMKNCTENNSGNLLSVGACLGTVAIETEMKGARFLATSGLSIARINLYLATLPAALEVCAGTQLVEAGLGTARIAVDIGSCSATSMFNLFNQPNNSNNENE